MEIQTFPIDPREMFRRFLADLESGFWWTAWVFTGSRAAPLLRTAEGSEVRLPADVLAAQGALHLPDGAKSRQQLADLVGLDPASWMGTMLAESYGCIAALRGVKCLDAEGALWSLHLDSIARPDRWTGHRRKALQSTKRVVQKREIAFDLFGPVWGAGDAQRHALATTLATALSEAETTIEWEEVNVLAVRTLGIARTTATDEWSGELSRAWAVTCTDRTPRPPCSNARRRCF